MWLLVQGRLGLVRAGRACSSAARASTVECLQQSLQVPQAKAEYILLKQPSLVKFGDAHIRQVVEVATSELGFDKAELAAEPLIFTYLPVTLRHRYTVLRECGLTNVSASDLSKYLNIVKRRTIADLKATGLIPVNVDVSRRLADIFTQWPTSRSTAFHKVDEYKCTPQDLRMSTLQRYLELVIDLSEEKFYKALKVYVRIKHRSFHAINETLILLQKHILMPNEKICSNLFLVHAEPDNIKQFIYQLRSIGGMDIKEILRMHPKLCTSNCSTVIQTLKLFEEYGINKEAQTKCIEILTLSTETVKERLDKAKTVPEFDALFNHPRILKLIHHNNKAADRLDKIYKKTSKKCLSLNILSGSTEHFKIYEKNPGDRTKGTDVIKGIASKLEPHFSKNVIEMLKRHPFWINIPLVSVKLVLNKLLLNFSSAEICENCAILLYPWNKVERIMNVLLHNCNFMDIKSQVPEFVYLDATKLTKSQILSLALYILEIDHYYSGNGVWTDEKLNEINTLEKNKTRIVTTVEPQ